MTFFFFFGFGFGFGFVFLFYYYFFNIVLTQKIVGASKASVLYIYIDNKKVKQIYTRQKIKNKKIHDRLTVN